MPLVTKHFIKSIVLATYQTKNSFTTAKLLGIF